MTENELLDLIAEYNQVEAGQVTKRRDIFSALHVRKSYRMIRIGRNRSWSGGMCYGTLAADLAAMEAGWPGDYMTVESLGDVA